MTKAWHEVAKVHISKKCALRLLRVQSKLVTQTFDAHDIPPFMQCSFCWGWKHKPGFNWTRYHAYMHPLGDRVHRGWHRRWLEVFTRSFKEVSP